MSDPFEAGILLAKRLRSGDELIGSFVKTPHPTVVEALAGTGLDFLVLDAEHGCFDRTSINACILAGLAWGCPVMVRVPVVEPDWIGFALDCGAAGLFLPHVSSRAEAERAARLVSFDAGGERGFSPGVRAGLHGRRSLAGYKREARSCFSLICQIEDPAGIAAIGEIAAVDGVDALFIGAADLTIAMGLDDMEHPDVVRLCMEGVAEARTHAPVAMLVPDMGKAQRWRGAGASVFLVGSDHSLMAAGVAARATMRAG